MSVEDYKTRGRSEMLRTVTTGEILKLTHALTQGSVDILNEGGENEEGDAEVEVAADAPR